jgi:hypothetical protein
MEALLQDPETTGVSVEILPDLFVPADIARRVQMLVVGLAASLAALALDRGLIDPSALAWKSQAPRTVARAATSPTEEPRYRLELHTFRDGALQAPE